MILPFGARTFEQARAASRARIQSAQAQLTLLARTYKRDKDGQFASTGGVRESLANAEDVEAIGTAAAAEAKRITGRDISFDFAGSDPQIAREHAEGVLQGLERYPGTRLDRVGAYGPGSRSTVAGNEDAYAVTIGGGSIYFNNRHAANPAQYRADLSGEPPLRSQIARDPRGVALHEFGHVVADGGAAGHAGAIVAERAAAAAGDTVKLHVAANISSYATASAAELGAEAFADVMLNGGNASRLSREIVDIENEAAGF